MVAAQHTNGLCVCPRSLFARRAARTALFEAVAPRVGMGIVATTGLPIGRACAWTLGLGGMDSVSAANVALGVAQQRLPQQSPENGADSGAVALSRSVGPVQVHLRPSTQSSSGSH